MVPHLFHSIHAIQELVCDRVQLQQVHAVEGSLQQLKDGGELKRSKGFRRKNPRRVKFMTDPFLD